MLLQTGSGASDSFSSFSKSLVYRPVQVGGSIELSHVPYSKSYMIRVLSMAMLSGTLESIRSFRSPEHSCRDIDTMREALLTLHYTESDVLHVEDAGTVWRFLVAITALITTRKIGFTGTPRLFDRPIASLVQALQLLGANISFDPNQAQSIRINPPSKGLSGGLITSEIGKLSSQFISALMLIAPYLEEKIRFEITPSQRSKPYTELTYKLMQEAGAKVLADEDWVEIEPGPYDIQSIERLIKHPETDWTALSYIQAWCALPNGPKSIFVPNCFRESMQGDVALLKLMTSFGVATRFFPHGILIERIKKSDLTMLTLDLAAHIDLVPTFVFLCLMLGRPFVFKRVGALRFKESDRIASILGIAYAMGYKVEATEDELLWKGKRTEFDAPVLLDPCGDHRLAMAASLFALGNTSIRIIHPEVVEKSYPHFWLDAKSIGLHLEE